MQDEKDRSKRIEDGRLRRMRKIAEVNTYNIARGTTPREVCTYVCMYVCMYGAVIFVCLCVYIFAFAFLYRSKYL